MQTSPEPISVCNPTVGPETVAMGRMKKRNFFYLEKKLRDSHRLVAALQDALVQSQRKTAFDYDLGWCHAKTQERQIWDLPAQQIVSTISSIWKLLSMSFVPGLSNPPGLYSYMAPPDESPSPEAKQPTSFVPSNEFDFHDAMGKDEDTGLGSAEQPISFVPASEEFDIYGKDDDIDPSRRSSIARCYDLDWGVSQSTLEKDDAEWSNQNLLRILEEEREKEKALQASQEKKQLWLDEARAARDAEPPKIREKASLPHRSKHDCPTWDSESEYWMKEGCLCDLQSPPEVKFLSRPPEPGEPLSMPSSSRRDSRPAAKETAENRGDRCRPEPNLPARRCGCSLEGVSDHHGVVHKCQDSCKTIGCNGTCREFDNMATILHQQICSCKNASNPHHTCSAYCRLHKGCNGGCLDPESEEAISLAKDAREKAAIEAKAANEKAIREAKDAHSLATAHLRPPIRL